MPQQTKQRVAATRIGRGLNAAVNFAQNRFNPAQPQVQPQRAKAQGDYFTNTLLPLLNEVKPLVSKFPGFKSELDTLSADIKQIWDHYKNHPTAQSQAFFRNLEETLKEAKTLLAKPGINLSQMGTFAQKKFFPLRAQYYALAAQIRSNRAPVNPAPAQPQAQRRAKNPLVERLLPLLNALFEAGNNPQASGPEKMKAIGKMLMGWVVEALAGLFRMFFKGDPAKEQQIDTLVENASEFFSNWLESAHPTQQPMQPQPQSQPSATPVASPARTYTPAASRPIPSVQSTLPVQTTSPGLQHQSPTSPGPQRRSSF